MSTMFSKTDADILRELAKQVAVIAREPGQAEKAKLWQSHNDLQSARPMVLVFPEGAWREMLPRTAMRCAPGVAQDYEYDLRVRLYYHEHLPDDNVIEADVASPIILHSTGWGIEAATTRPDETEGAYHIEPVIRSEADLDRLRIPQLTVDWPATEVRFAAVQEVFGDLLPVERVGVTSYGLAPLDFYAQLRGIDQLYLDLVDRPEMIHRAIGRIVDGHIAMLKSLEAQGGLSLGNRRHYTGSGGTGYTRELPAAGFDGQRVRICDLWGFATAQIFSEVSPEMHEEFALQHERRALELFGLNCYGCCEPLHNKLEYVKRIPRLRRISISPWADVVRSAESLGDRYVFSWKPNPAIVAGEQWDPVAVRRGIRDFLTQTRGCVVEMILKDTHTSRNDPRRMWEWVQIAKSEALAFAGG